MGFLLSVSLLEEVGFMPLEGIFKRKGFYTQVIMHKKCSGGMP
ncbi:MAG: hypothetical protein RMK35_05095 [Aquificaceae bacterium]|nr:hypothetical protein [Aquificaceae bacterium]MDW8434163.1 hypothetical protein [Aquificaceae bacterium]